MNSTRTHEQNLLQAALALASEAQREAFLNAACGNDSTLQQRLRELIAASKESDSFFQQAPMKHAGLEAVDAPAATIRLDLAPDETPGERIGRYKLLQKIGEGGMGVVYMAEQEEPVRRRVALKIIKLGMDTKQVVARFEAERQALAMMDHPNIAKVLDAGATETGRPYFVMELVQGVPITEFCDKTKLSAKDRLKLFVQVCQAVQHAHQKGIIHRDIKPSNVLVTLHDGVPVPKVIDFGVAKATNQKLTEKTLFTNFATMIGTPAYMSPEQAEMSGLDIDTRTDIYALGVLLYQLLTGTTPFTEKRLRSLGYGEMQRLIMEEEPERPSTRLSTMDHAEKTLLAKNRGEEFASLTHLLKGDLDWIIMKCLEKDRSRRYDTANGLAADIQRHLSSEPVIARPPSTAYRFQKAFRRNKLAFAAVGAVSLALIAGLIATGNQALRAKRAETLAKVRLSEAEHAREDAEEVSKFLQQVFQSPDPSREGRTITVAETLDRAVKQLDTNLKDQPDRRARLQATLASTYYALGLYKSAIPLQEQTRTYWMSKRGPEASETIAAIQDLGDSYYDSGRPNDALKIREEALALSRKVNGSEHPETLRAMYALALSHSNIPGRTEDVRKLREQVLALRRKVLGPEHPDTIRSMIGLALSYRDYGRREESLKLLQQAYDLSRNVLGPEHPRTFLAMLNLSEGYKENGKWDDAIKMGEETLQMSRKVNGPEHPRTFTAMRSLAGCYSDAGKWTEALKLHEDAVAFSRRINGAKHRETIFWMSGLAHCYGELNRKDEELKVEEEVVALCKEVGLEDRNTIVAMNNLAVSYGLKGRNQEALKMREEGLALSRKVNGPEDSDTIDLMRDLARSYLAVRKTEKAFELIEEIVAIRRKVSGPGHPDTILDMDWLAVLRAVVGQKDTAFKIWEEALELSRNANGSAHSATLQVMDNLGSWYGAAGRKEESIKILEEALALSRKANGNEHAFTLEVMNDLAGSCSNAGHTKEALKLGREAVNVSRKVFGTNDIRSLKAVHNLGGYYIRAGQRVEAREVLKTIADKGINDWLILAPISYEGNDGNRPLEEQQVSGEATLHPREADHAQSAGKELTWNAYHGEDSILDFDSVLGRRVEHAVAYAVCYLVTAEDQNGIVMTISSDDQSKVYLNGKEIYKYLKQGTLMKSSDKVEGIELKRGVNALVVKIVNTIMNWQCAVNFTDAQGQPLRGIRVTLDPNQKE